MAETIDELLVGLGLETDKRSFEQGMSAFGGLRTAALNLAGVLGVGLGANSLVSGFANANDELGKFADNMGISAQFVDSLGFALERSGGNAEDAMSSISNMTSLFDEFARGDTGRFDAAAMFGFDARTILDAEDTADAFERLARATGDMDGNTRRRVLEALGFGSQAELTLLSGGEDALQSLMQRAQELAPVLEEDTEIAAEFRDSLTDLMQSLEGVSDVVSRQLLPDLIDFSEWASEFLVNNKDDIASFINDGPVEFGRKYGEAARSRVAEWIDGLELRRGQGGGSAQASPAPASRPPSVTSSNGDMFRGAPDQGIDTWIPDIWPETLDAIREMQQGPEDIGGDYSPGGLDRETLEAIQRRQERGDFRPEDQQYLNQQMRNEFPERYQGSTVNHWNITGVNAQEIGSEVDRRLRQHAERTADDFRSSLV